MPKASALITVALAENGYQEGANNHTKFGDWYASQVHDQSYAYAAWCDEFVSWCANKAGLSKEVGRFAYTPAHARWFANQGKLGHTPAYGALVFYDWGGSRNIDAIDHVGIVTKVRSDGRIQTIEGNTSNQVAERVRDLSYVAGFGYPAYSSGGTPTPPPKPTPPPGTHTYPGHMIQRGSTGNDVKLVQRKVGVNADGVFGPITERAVISWQHVHHLTPDGQVGPLTWRAMFG